jgi:predicted NBD/HSP70 family sugar kinase
MVSVPSHFPPRWPAVPDTERRVLLELLVHGAQSRVRIAEALGLSRTSLTRTARGLVAAGLITEGASLPLGTRGRPAEVLHLREDAAHFVGVKLTADRMYLVVTDLAANIVAETSVALHSRQLGDVVALVAQEILRVGPHHGEIAATGIAVAGDVTLTGEGAILRHSHFLGWDDVALSRMVTAATGLPTTIVNDVHALAGAHHWFGGDTRHGSLVVYGVGAGIGCGVVIGEELHRGAHGRAGRVGHSRVGGKGRRCANGHRDCVHSFVTMPAIEHNAGVEPGGYDVALDRARAGDIRVIRAFDAAARALGAAVAEAVNAFDPDAIVVMGEGTDMLDISPGHVREALAEYLEQGDPDSIRIERPPFHFDLYARGAAVAAMRELLA